MKLNAEIVQIYKLLSRIFELTKNIIVFITKKTIYIHWNIEILSLISIALQYMNIAIKRP